MAQHSIGNVCRSTVPTSTQIRCHTIVTNIGLWPQNSVNTLLNCMIFRLDVLALLHLARHKQKWHLRGVFPQLVIVNVSMKSQNTSLRNLIMFTAKQLQ
jgi:hypothetical protein